MSEIEVFNGGLNTRVDAKLLHFSEGRTYKNIDQDSYVLKPIKGNKKAPNVAVNRYAYFSIPENIWYSSTVPTDWVEYKQRIYKNDRVSGPKQVIGGVEYNLGIAKPSGTVTITTTNAPRAVERVDFTSGSGSGDLPPGTYEYKISNKDSVTGLISFSYFEREIEESTTRPEVQSTRAYDSETTKNAFKFVSYVKGTVEATHDFVDIDVVDTNANQVRVFRKFDNVWRALTADYQAAATTVNDTVYDISANDELIETELVNGDIQYALTFYSTLTGAESEPLLLDEVNVINGSVALTGLPTSTDTQVDKLRIYRIGNNITAFSLVVELAEGTTSHTDQLNDTDIVGTLLTTTSSGAPPTGLKFLVEAYAMFIGAVADKLYFTPIGQPWSWPVNNFLDFSEAITGISKTSLGILVHSKFRTFLVTGTGPTSFTQQLLSGDQGCISHDTIVETKDTAIWMSTDGVCASDGSDVKVISRDKLGKLTTPTASAVNAVLYDQVYQFLRSDNTVLALDFDRGIFKEFDYGLDYLVVANDVLYGHSGGSLFEINKDDTALLSQEFVSKDFVMDSILNAKTYDSFKFYSTGTVTVEVFIDGISRKTHTATTSGLHKVKLPLDYRIGYYINFKVSGTGTVRALSWEEETANGE